MLKSGSYRSETRLEVTLKTSRKYFNYTMIRKIAFLVLCVLAVWPVSAQIHLPGFQEKLINPALREGYWSAQWIGVPSARLRDYGVYHFRKTIQLETVPQTYVIHVSADNRYKLFVNDSLVSLGPCRGDLSNWNFETLDIARFLKVGKNTLAAVVWFYGQACPVARFLKAMRHFWFRVIRRKKKKQIRTIVGSVFRMKRIRSRMWVK